MEVASRDCVTGSDACVEKIGCDGSIVLSRPGCRDSAYCLRECFSAVSSLGCEGKLRELRTSKMCGFVVIGPDGEALVRPSEWTGPAYRELSPGFLGHAALPFLTDAPQPQGSPRRRERLGGAGVISSTGSVFSPTRLAFPACRAQGQGGMHL